MKKISSYIIILILLSTIVLSSTIIGKNTTVVLEEFEVKIYAEEKYKIKVPSGCYPTKYVDKLNGSELIVSIFDNPKFICVEEGLKIFNGSYFKDDIWIPAGSHVVNVTKTKIEIAQENNITPDNISERAKDWINNKKNKPEEIKKGAPWWVWLLIILVILFGVGIATTVYNIFD